MAKARIYINNKERVISIRDRTKVQHVREVEFGHSQIYSRITQDISSNVPPGGARVFVLTRSEHIIQTKDDWDPNSSMEWPLEIFVCKENIRNSLQRLRKGYDPLCCIQVQEKEAGRTWFTTNQAILRGKIVIGDRIRMFASL